MSGLKCTMKSSERFSSILIVAATHKMTKLRQITRGLWNAVSCYVIALGWLFLACSPSVTPGEWRLAFADLDRGRIGICRLDGSMFRYITPDSLFAQHPSADSTGHIVIFAATSPDNPDGPSALYSIQSDGSGLELLTYAPFRIYEVTAGPDGAMALFVGRYADSDMPRVYRYRKGEPGFTAVLGPERIPLDLAMPPTGANFLFHDYSGGDTMWVGNAAGGLPIPIYNLPFSQCSFSPDGLSLVSVDRESRNTLALFDFRDWSVDTLVAPDSDGVTLADPAFHPAGRRACFIRREGVDELGRVAVVDLNSLELKLLPAVVPRPARPAWVR